MPIIPGVVATHLGVSRRISGSDGNHGAWKTATHPPGQPALAAFAAPLAHPHSGVAGEIRVGTGNALGTLWLLSNTFADRHLGINLGVPRLPVFLPAAGKPVTGFLPKASVDSLNLGSTHLGSR